MTPYSSPYFDFFIPSDIVSEDALERARKDEDLGRLARLMLVNELRERADYFKYLPKINRRLLDKNQENALGENLAQVKNPNYYLRVGGDIYNHPLIEDWLVSDNAKELKPGELPSLRRPLSDFAGTLTLKDYVHNPENKMQFLYWAVKTGIFDTIESPVSQNYLNAFRTPDNWTRDFSDVLEYYNNRTIIDIELSEEIRSKDMQKSERNFVQAIQSDRLGFFEDINVVTNQSYNNKLAFSAFAPDNRRQFQTNDLPNFIKSSQANDFINYRFNVVNISGIDYLEVEFAFPQADAARKLAGGANFTAKSILNIYGKIE